MPPLLLHPSPFPRHLTSFFRPRRKQNVLICSDGSVKIADFGCARKILGNSYMPSTISGSPAFMAPEQLAGKELSLKLDVWALGVLMWEIFSEKLPWEENGRATMGMQGLENMKTVILTKKKTLPPVQTSKMPAGFSGDVQNIINAFMTRDVANRPDIADGHAALDNIWSGLKSAAANKLGGAANGSSASADKSLETKLEAFYKVYNPEKISQVTLMAKQYQNNLSSLNAKLRERYNADLDTMHIKAVQQQQQQQHVPEVASTPNSEPAKEYRYESYPEPAKEYRYESYQQQQIVPPPREAPNHQIASSGSQASGMTCPMCPHKGVMYCPDGHHEIYLAGGVKYRGTVCNGECVGAGEIILIDNTKFSTGGGGQDDQVLRLIEELKNARASLRQALLDGDAERIRALRLEESLNQTRNEVDRNKNVIGGTTGIKSSPSSSDFVTPLGVRN